MLNALMFANKTGLFNPSLFSEIYFFLHNQDKVHGKLVDELCSVVRSPDICRMCIVSQCIWNIFFRNIKKLHIERAPPCVRNAYFKRKFELVLRYFSFAFPLREKATLSCREMIERGLCSPDKFCKNMKNNLTLYSTERLKLKIVNAKKMKE